MATFMDIGLFRYFNVIFPVLLIFAVFFAILQKTKILGKNPTINAVVAVAVALMSLLSDTIIKLINFMAPWFVLVFIFVILLLLIYQLLGATEGDILGALKSEKSIQWAVFGIAIVILMAGLGTVLGQKMLPITQEGAPETAAVEGGEGVAGEDWQRNVLATLFNPKILGVIMIFLVAIFAVAFLSSG